MDFISYDDFKKTNEYQTFINENPGIGKLKVEAFTAYESIPIPDTKILITKEIGNKDVLFFSGNTNENGIIEDIELPAPPPVADPTPEDTPKYTVYNLSAIHEGYETIKKYKVGMFGDIKIIQYVKMTPEITLKGVEESGD